ncbi:VCBS domain-containing protein, partial [Vibrio sp. 10N.261.49.A5]
QNVTITINGADDDSTITVTGDNDKGSVTEDTDVKAGDLLVTSGELSISDADGDNAFNTTPVFKSIVSTDDSGNHPTTALGQFAINAAGKWTFNVDNNSALVQGLKEGESIVQVYEVTSKDGTA